MENWRIGSNQARDNFAEVLGHVEHDDVHYTVMRYKKPAAVIVPIDWYEQVKGLLENGKQS
jgi:prevent-host-death family protein